MSRMKSGCNVGDEQALKVSRERRRAERAVMAVQIVAARRTLFSIAFVFISYLLLYRLTGSLRFSISSFPSIFPSYVLDKHSLPENKLETVLRKAAMPDRTVILTTMNQAWAAPGSIFDLFLESFRIGDGTHRLLDHLVVIALDDKAYRRCSALHKHCYAFVTDQADFHKEAYFMTSLYLKMMWARLDFLRSVLEMGYNFVFTDADIMWFRDPFPRFYPDADFQITCDNFLGSSYDIENRPNGGFNYVQSNNRSIQFYKFWYSSRETYPGNHDQDVLNVIKSDPFIIEIGLKMRFLDTAFFGGLCEPSRDLNVVCTMHANCCIGLESKIHDLRVMLQDWRFYLSMPPNQKRTTAFSWNVPQNCSLDALQQNGSPSSSLQNQKGSD